MLAPGSKGWILKYFDMVEKGDLWISIRNYESLSQQRHFHLTFSRCGIVFGLATRAIFGHTLDARTWTREERLKVLLMEALLFVHLKNGGDLDRDVFVDRLIRFYNGHDALSVRLHISLFKKEERPEIQLEKILAERIDIPRNILENKWWVNSLTNAFVYLDVILFHEFLTNNNEKAIGQYSEFAKNALLAVTLGSYADGTIENHEKDLFNLFLASANLSEEHREEAELRFHQGAGIHHFDPWIHEHWLLKRFLLDLATLTVFSKLQANDSERAFLDRMCDFLEVPIGEQEETLMFIENFIIENRDQVDFLCDAPSYERVYGSFTQRWRKILIRNKDKVAVELRESKELVFLLKKSRTEELTPEERNKVKKQSKDLLKSLPAVAIFMIPGGSILLPMMTKLIPDLLPSAFRENEIDD